MAFRSIISAVVFIAGAVGSTAATADCVGPFDPEALYGDRVAFEVRREGRRVGFHETRFDREGDFLRVTSEMKLTVKLLFIPVYKFRYQAEELWCDGAVHALESSVNDNGKKNEFFARRQNDELLIEGDEDRTVPGHVLTTNHWNPAVLDDRAVLNTLTGNLNTIEIEPMGQELVETKSGAIEATRYRYSGELKTEAWYDRLGRWVKLRFEADDGSIIEYVCTTCTSTGGQS